jgi:hypothetical protein
VRAGGARNGLRPSRSEKARYTDALAAAVAEGRLTDALYEERLAAAEQAVSFAELEALVADVPFDSADPQERRRGGGVAALAGALAVVLLSGGAAFGLVRAVAGGDDGPEAVAEAGTQGGGDGTGEDAGGAEADQLELDLHLDTVPAMEDGSVPAAIEAAQEAGLVDIDRVTLNDGFTYVDGRDGEGEYFSLSVQPDRLPTLSEGSEWRGVFLDLDAVDFDLDEVVSRAREYDPSAGEAVRSVMVYRGTGGPADSGEDGTLVDVDFEESEEPFGVTMRLSDLERVE